MVYLIPLFCFYFRSNTNERHPSGPLALNLDPPEPPRDLTPAQIFRQRGKTLDMIADYLECHQNGYGEEHTGNPPQPAQQQKSDEHHDGVQAQTASDHNWLDELPFQ